LNTIRSLWIWCAGFSFFCFAAIVVALSILLLSREKTGKITRFLFRIQVRLVGIQLVVNGQEHISKDKPYLIMGNHQSLFDIFVVPAAIPVTFVGIEAARHFSYPFFGYLTRKWGNIPIRRNDLNSAKKSLKLVQQTIENGMSIGVMPEGHRTTTGKMNTFKKGPFHLAKSAQADILPFGVKGLYQYNRKGDFMIYPGRVTVTFGQPIAYQEFKDCSVEQIRDRVFCIVNELSQ
jgi:1-acyl-sn-glycerol-3-phosphate acyltransferase